MNQLGKLSVTDIDLLCLGGRKNITRFSSPRSICSQTFAISLVCRDGLYFR